MFLKNTQKLVCVSIFCVLTVGHKLATVSMVFTVCQDTDSVIQIQYSQARTLTECQLPLPQFSLLRYNSPHHQLYS